MHIIFDKHVIKVLKFLERGTGSCRPLIYTFETRTENIMESEVNDIAVIK